MTYLGPRFADLQVMENHVDFSGGLAQTLPLFSRE